jgi:hypothetical protein
MRSVAKEVRRVGWCVRVLASSKGRLSCANEWTSTAERTLETRLAPYTVTLVEHDDLRNLASHLAAQMPDTAFVYDEVRLQLTQIVTDMLDFIYCHAVGAQSHGSLDSTNSGGIEAGTIVWAADCSHWHSNGQ